MTAARINKLRRKIRRRRTLRRWRFPIITLILLLLGAAAYGGNWAYGKILNRQAYALVSRAFQDLQDGKPTEARMAVETALRILPGHPPATRILARIQAASGEPSAALATFQKLTDERQLTLDDLRLYASLAQGNGETQLASRLANAVGANGDPSFPHLLQASTLIRQNKTAEAEAALRAAVAADPGDTNRSTLLEFLLQTRRPGQSMAEAATLIQDFSTRDSTLGVRALTLGLTTGLMNPDKRPEWIEKLRNHPQVDLPSRLVADSAAIDIDPDSKPRITDQLLQFATPLPLPDRTRAALWLTAQKQFPAALTLLPLDDAITQSPSFIAWLDIQAALKDWNTPLTALARPDNPLPPHLTPLFQGFAHKNLNQPDQARTAFQQAIQLANNNPATFADVTSYLITWGEDTLLQDNLDKVADQPELAPALMAKCQSHIQSRRDAQFTLQFLQSLAHSDQLATDPTFQNLLTHHRLILRQPTPLDFLRQHNATDPDNLSILATLALAELLDNRPETAMRLFDNYGPVVEAHTLPPRILSIYSATLAANNKPQLALKIASLIPPQALSKQEIDFLKTHLNPPN